MLQFKEYDVTLTFTEPMLGTTPLELEVFTKYGNHDEVDEDLVDEEAEMIEQNERPGWTGFLRDEDGNPLVLDYIIKGFFKGACSALRREDFTLSSKIRAYKKNIDGLVFVNPRRILLEIPDGESVTEATVDDQGLALPNIRPLRGQTPQGERISIVRSESVPAGTVMHFTVSVLGGEQVPEDLLREWFDYGHLMGIGQWRGAGWGRFSYEMVEKGA